MRAESKPVCHWPLAEGFCRLPNLNSPYDPILRPSRGESMRPKMALSPALFGSSPGVATRGLGSTPGWGGVPGATPDGCATTGAVAGDVATGAGGEPGAAGVGA